MDVDAPPRKSQAVDVEDVGSPQRATTTGASLAEIQALLEAQSKSLRESQKEDIGLAVQHAVARSEKRTLAALEEIKQGFLKETERTRQEVAAIAKDQKLLLEKLEARPSSMGSTTASEGEARKPALIFGGWHPKARRELVLNELQGVLHDVGADELLHEKPWTPGPRRGIALAAFQPRAGEGPADVRARMLEVVNLINRAAIPTESTLDGRPVWSSISKDKSDRVESAHASKLRRLLHTVQANVDDTDADYKEGSLWLGDHLLGSVKLPVPEGINTLQGKIAGSWVAPGVVAAATGIQEDVIVGAWERIMAN